MVRSAITVAVLFGAGSVCMAQTGLLDQESPAVGASFNGSAASLTWQQQIRAGMDGQLEGIVLPTLGDIGAQVEVRIRLGAAWSTETPAFTAMITKQIQGIENIFIDMTASNIQLSNGQPFVMETQGNNTGMNLRGSYVAPPGTPNYPEPLWLNMGPFADNGWRHGFQTYMIQGGGCYPNCDGSTVEPILNIDDFTCFINEFAAAQSLPHEQQLNHYANCDQSTVAPVLNIDDFTCFINSFAAGCS